MPKLQLLHRTARLVMVVASFAATAAAQTSQPAPAEVNLPQDELEKLVAPIALYPDVLVSQILPAATFPTDIVLAARWAAEHPDLKDLDKQSWDLSVISIVRYPTILQKMNTDLDWTNALGTAFMQQPADVLAAIQNLRHQAASAGVLQTTVQQSVVYEQEAIRIVPTEKEVVYVPEYDPTFIYVDDDDDDYDGISVATVATSAALSFGAGLAMGCWLDNDCDWYGGAIVGCRPGYWGGYGWRGAVAWDDDWVAARGARRGFVAGENGGAYVGPRGAAVWGENGHGAAWARTGARPAPYYGGRYASYNNFTGNRRNTVAGNTVNVNRNNVNIDRGDRSNIRGGDRTNVGNANIGNRTGITGGGGDRTNIAGGAGGGRTNIGANRPSQLPSNPAWNSRSNASTINQQRDRGQASRSSISSPGGANRTARPSPQPARSPSQARPAPRPQQVQRSPSASRSSSAFSGSSRSAGSVSRSSSRGSVSRGGGGRGGGGRGGGRR